MKKTIIGCALFIGGSLLLCGAITGNENGFVGNSGIIIGLIGLFIMICEFIRDFFKKQQ